MTSYRHFTYRIVKTIDIPDYITVKGKKIKAVVDDDYLEDGYYPSVGYADADEVEGVYYWEMTLFVDTKGEFFIRLTFNGEIVAEDNFYPDDTPIQQMIDRFIDTLGGLL